MDTGLSFQSQVHARIGSSQLPQIADPLDRMRFKTEVAACFAFWEEVHQAHARQGRDALTITPEYGPAPYSINVSVVYTR